MVNFNGCSDVEIKCMYCTCTDDICSRVSVCRYIVIFDLVRLGWVARRMVGVGNIRKNGGGRDSMLGTFCRLNLAHILRCAWVNAVTLSTFVV